jgi:hypothetical protein
LEPVVAAPVDALLINDRQKSFAVIRISPVRKRNPVAANWNPAARRLIPVVVD